MILKGNCLDKIRDLDSESVHCCVTSPPYWGLRDYGVDGQLGLEPTPREYVNKIVDVFREVRRVLRDDGTLWLNLGDSYAQGGSGGSSSSSTLQGYTGDHVKQARQQARSFSRRAPEGLKPKDLVGIPWMVAFALRDDGWYLRQDIIWSKPNPMPESVQDRCTKAHEYIFLLSKSDRYYYDQEAIKEPATWGLPNSPESIASPYGQGFSRRASGGGKKYSDSAVVPGRTEGQNLDLAGQKTYEMRNKRSVWEVSTTPFSDAHFATFPPKLIEPCILAGCPRGGTVLDPFFGAGTTGLVALQNGREFIGIELNLEYIKIAEKRLRLEDTTPTMFDL